MTDSRENEEEFFRNNYFEFSHDADADDLNDWSPYMEFRVKLSGLFSNHIVTRTWSTSRESKTSVYVEKRQKSERLSLKKYVELHQNRSKVLKKREDSIREKERIANRLKDIPDVFIIRVGVLDGSEGHRTPGFVSEDGSVTTGYFQTYDELFYLLYHLSGGKFDPLRTVRTSRMRLWVESTIISEVKRILGRSQFNGRVQFSSALRKIGRDLRDFVRDYIKSGEKPPLDNTTVNSYRASKKAADFTLYPEGIDEPLVETGQLLDAIDFAVEMEQSDGLESYIKKNIKALAARRESVKRQLTKEEKEARRQKRLIEKIEKTTEKIDVLRGKRSGVTEQKKIEDIDEKIAETEEKIRQLEIKKSAQAIRDRYKIDSARIREIDKQIKAFKDRVSKMTTRMGLPQYWSQKDRFWLIDETAKHKILRKEQEAIAKRIGSERFVEMLNDAERYLKLFGSPIK